MWQILDIVFKISLLIEVLYMFSCGQRYMKTRVMRSRRNFQLERIVYLLIGVFAVIGVFTNTTPGPADTLFAATISFLFFLKCTSVIKIKKYKQP